MQVDRWWSQGATSSKTQNIEALSFGEYQANTIIPNDHHIHMYVRKGVKNRIGFFALSW